MVDSLPTIMALWQGTLADGQVRATANVVSKSSRQSQLEEADAKTLKIKAASDAMKLAVEDAQRVGPKLHAAEADVGIPIEQARSAISSDRVHMALQPVVDSITRQPRVYECLMRFEGSDGRYHSAEKTIQAAESAGESDLVDKRSFQLAMELLDAHRHLHLSLNLSSPTFSDPLALAKMSETLSRRPEIAKRLIIEVAETTAIQDVDQATRFVTTLQKLGCRLAIDDFGSGYTSFDILQALPVDIVKIDGSLVVNINKYPSQSAFLERMVELSRQLGMETVAEWITDAETANTVSATGVDYLQGYYFGEPVVPD